MTNPEPRTRQNYFVPVTGGVTTASNAIGVANSAVIPADGGRKKILFHNPNPAISLLLSQTLLADGSANNPTFAAPGGGYLLFAGGDREITGDAAMSAWQACAASGTTNGLTVTTSRE